MAIALRNSYLTYPGNAQTGVVVVLNDLIIFCYSYQGALATSTCTDNAAGGSNTYNRIAGSTLTDTTAGGELFYAIAKASETLTITCTAQGDNGLSVHVVSGNVTTLSSVLDVSNTAANAAGATQTSPNITTTVADSYLCSFWYQEGGTSTHTENGTSFTKRTEDTVHIHATFDRIVSSTGTYNNSITVTALTVQYGSIIAAFKGAAGGVAATTITGQGKKHQGFIYGGPYL